MRVLYKTSGLLHKCVGNLGKTGGSLCKLPGVLRNPARDLHKLSAVLCKMVNIFYRLAERLHEYQYYLRDAVWDRDRLHGAFDQIVLSSNLLRSNNLRHLIRSILWG